jgi:8-oxo-dGTP diphosphatase
LGPEGILYAPPGGGTEFGSGLEENLLREIKEETGILIEENQFQFVHEYIAPPLHAIELFFSVTTYSGTLLHGSDPELGKNEQIIEWVGFMAWPELKGLPPKQLHQILKSCPTPKSLKSISGLVKFGS